MRCKIIRGIITSVQHLILTPDKLAHTRPSYSESELANNHLNHIYSRVQTHLLQAQAHLSPSSTHLEPDPRSEHKSLRSSGMFQVVLSTAAMEFGNVALSTAAMAFGNVSGPFQLGNVPGPSAQPNSRRIISSHRPALEGGVMGVS